MIEEDDVFKALDFLRDNAPFAAKARAEREYVESYARVLKSQIMRENQGESIGAQEARAYSDPRYIKHLEAIRAAVEADEKIRFMLSAAETKIQAWRTFSSNNRPRV